MLAPLYQLGASAAFSNRRLRMAPLRIFKFCLPCQQTHLFMDI